MITTVNSTNPHALLVQNFVNAILDGEPLIAPGEEGIHSVELANVILFSSLLDQTIRMPMDSAAYEMKLNQLIAESKLEKKVVEAIIRGQYTPSPQQRQRIAAALGVDPEQIAWDNTIEVQHLYGHGPQFGRTP